VKCCRSGLLDRPDGLSCRIRPTYAVRVSEEPDGRFSIGSARMAGAGTLTVDRGGRGHALEYSVGEHPVTTRPSASLVGPGSGQRSTNDGGRWFISTGAGDGRGGEPPAQRPGVWTGSANHYFLPRTRTRRHPVIQAAAAGGHAESTLWSDGPPSRCVRSLHRLNGLLSVPGRASLEGPSTGWFAFVAALLSCV
jgi:hypothetical protein